MNRFSYLVPIVAMCWCVTALAAEPRAKVKGQAVSDEAAVRAAVPTYVAAYNRGDAKAVADHWSEQGEWISPAGERLRGRKAIEKGLEDMFKENQGARLEVSDLRVRLVSSDVAMEEGMARVTRPGQPPANSTYIAIHVKRDGRWKLDSVRETEIPASEQAPSPAGPLKDLKWMVGQWMDRDSQATVETAVAWTKNNRFLCCSFKVSAPGEDALEGTQVIGWDPVAKVIRSWVFDSDGGFGESTWTRKGDRWIVKANMVLQDGRQASATNIYTCLDADRYTWQSIGRQIDGQFLPNIEEVTVVRKSAAARNVPASKRAAPVKPATPKPASGKAVSK